MSHTEFKEGDVVQILSNPKIFADPLHGWFGTITRPFRNIRSVDDSAVMTVRLALRHPRYGWICAIYKHCMHLRTQQEMDNWILEQELTR